MKHATRLRVLAAIVTHVRRKGYPPTVRDLMEIVGLESPSSVHWHLRQLRDTGLIAVEADKPRTIRVTDEGLAALARIGVRL